MDLEFLASLSDKMDSLTKVYNREAILLYVDKLIKTNTPFAFSMLDVDNFKYINDSYGHIVGDDVLTAIAQEFKSKLEGAVIGRYGGDEFVIIKEDIQTYDEVWNFHHSNLAIPKEIKFQEYPEIQITVTIGMSRFPHDSTNIDGLMELADKALYRGKMKGRNCFIIYLPEKHANIDLKTAREKAFSSMYLHQKVFTTLTESKSISKGIKSTIDFLGSYLMIDHLCLSTDKNLYFEYFHPLCTSFEFKPIPRRHLESNLNQTTYISYQNTVFENKPYTASLKKQHITSDFNCEIRAFGKSYGFIRADIVNKDGGRIWQTLDMDLLINAAQTIGLMLYYNNTTLEELDK